MGIVRKKGSKQKATESVEQDDVVVPAPKKARKSSDLAAEVRELSAEAAKPGKKKTNPPIGKSVINT